MRRLNFPFVLLPGLLPLALAGCHESYSPNTYASNAAQQEANVQRGVIIGVRQVMISTNGAIGTATGGAVGGVAGAQVAGGAAGTALGAIAGTLVGGIGGTAAAKAVTNTKGWEYIVQETGDKLVSVTQTSKTALPIGLHVLVIADSQQARIVPDYTVQVTAPPIAKATGNTEIHLSPLQPAADTTAPLDVAPIAVAADPPAPAPAPASASPATPPPAPSAGGTTEAGSGGGSSAGAVSAAPLPAPVQSAPAAPAAAPPAASTP